MALFQKKTNKEQVEATSTEKKINLYPVVHVADSLKDYQKQLVLKEVESLQELREVQLAFDEVLAKDTILREKLEYFYYYMCKIMFKGIENPNLKIGDIIKLI